MSANMLRHFIFWIFILLLNFSFGQSNKCATKIRTEYQAKNTSQFQNISNQTWRVPVIFHVLYHNKSENIADSFILGILETLHADFLNLNDDLSSVPVEFKSLVGNPNVNFVIADKLPDGLSTNGIIRKFTNTRQFRVSRRKVFEESPIIANRSYLNVYICNVNTNAYTPSESNPQHDGIVINYRKTFKGSRTLTHETGHWFDLRHIFEGDCRDKDSIQDTPSQKKHSFYCPTYPNNECGHSTMFNNYMDYSSCRYFFTKGQVERMRNYIITYKNFN